MVELARLRDRHRLRRQLRVIGVDIDILDNSLALRVKQVFIDRLGFTPLQRVGKAPKVLLVYRVSSPMTKLSLHPIEVLASGQQFVAYGIHPDTGSRTSGP